MEKLIRDGKVAVLISHGYGAGWYSWHGDKRLLFDPKIVEMVEQDKSDQIDEDWIKENIGIEHVYCGGASSLNIHWLPVGTVFEVREYDGAESIITLEHFDLVA